MSKPHRKYLLMVQRTVEVNTDPQRRCYNGCHFSSEFVKQGWEVLDSSDNKEELERDAKSWQELNRHRRYEYKVEENPEWGH